MTLYESIEQISPVLWQDLASLPSERVEQATGALFNPHENSYKLKFLSEDYYILVNEKTFKSPINHKTMDFTKGLVLLSWLIGAKADIGESGELISPSALKGGALFFQGIHSLPSADLLKVYAKKPEELLEKAKKLGASVESSLDCSTFVLKALPYLSVSVTFYPEDEEFPADIIYAIDSSSQYHLRLDAILALFQVLNRELF